MAVVFAPPSIAVVGWVVESECTHSLLVYALFLIERMEPLSDCITSRSARATTPWIC